MQDNSKTLKEWLSQLEEPYRTKALNHCEAFGRLNDTAKSIDMAVVFAFVWGDTPETFKYWYNLFYRLRKETPK